MYTRLLIVEKKPRFCVCSFFFVFVKVMCKKRELKKRIDTGMLPGDENFQTLSVFWSCLALRERF